MQPAKELAQTNYPFGILAENKLTSYHLLFCFPKRFIKKF